MRYLLLTSMLAAGGCLAACSGSKTAPKAPPPAPRASVAVAPAPGSTSPALPATLAPPVIAPAVVGTITPDVAALLDRFSLTPAELPSGYAALGKVLLPNDQATLGTADPQATLKQIQQTGRQGGVAQQVIGPGLDSGQIGVSVEVFKDPSGAQQWVARPPDFDQTYRTSAAALPDPLGEQSNAVHWTQGNMGGYVVNFRRGRLVFGLGLSAAAGKESLDPLLSIARRLDEKAKQQTN